MSRQRVGCLGLIVVTFLIGGVAFAASSDGGFYKGKTIRLTIAFSAAAKMKQILVP